MGKENIRDFGAVKVSIPDVVQEVINGSGAYNWTKNAKETLHATLAETMQRARASCDDRWNNISTLKEGSKVTIINTEDDEPVSVIDLRTFSGLGIKPHAVSRTVKSALNQTIAMLGANVATIAELDAKRMRKGQHYDPGISRRTTFGRTGTHPFQH